MCRSNADPVPLSMRTYPAPSAPLKRQGRSTQKYMQKSTRYNQHSPSNRCECVALDCELVGVGPSKVSVLARVTMVDLDGKTVFDTFVKVDEKITDYRTTVSGITSEDLEGDNVMSYGEARDHVKRILNGKILVGHGLQNDLQVLRLHHPYHMTRDTSQYVPFMREIGTTGTFRPRRLRDLVWDILGEVIQAGTHCSEEDSLAAMSLYKLVKDEWNHCIEADMAQQRAYYEQQVNPFYHRKTNVEAWPNYYLY